MATLNAAEMLNIENQVGSIEIGKDADFIVLEGHPFDYFGDFGNVLDICNYMVIIIGQFYYSEMAYEVMSIEISGRCPLGVRWVSVRCGGLVAL